MPRRLPLVFLSLSLVLVACRGETAPPTSLEPTTSTSSPVATTVPSAPATTQTPTTEPTDPLTAQIRELVTIAADIRGLDFLAEPDITILTKEELAERVRQDLEEELDPEEYAIDDALYTLLGLLSPEDDLLEMFVALQEEQTVAFYDTETKELVAPASDEGLTPTEKMTFVHELVHALTDQHFDLFTVMDGLDEDQRYDEAVAFRSLIEGDATVAELVYIQDLPREEILQIFADIQNLDTPVFDATPRWLTDALLFPYIQGTEFVTELWAVNGFSGVDQAYLERPSTTEQIAEPSAYTSHESGRVVELPQVTLDGYEVVEASSWGYLGFESMFTEALGERVALEATEGWGGDRYQVHWNGTEVVFVLSYVGDTEEDAVQLHDALNSYVGTSMNVGPAESIGTGTSFVGEDFAFVSRSGDQVLFVAAGIPSDGQTALGAFLGS